jgi:hypothetical protein
MIFVMRGFLSEEDVEHFVVQVVRDEVTFMSAHRKCCERVKSAFVRVFADQLQTVLFGDVVWTIVREFRVCPIQFVNDSRVNDLRVRRGLEIHIGTDRVE